MKINNKEYNVDELVAKEHFSFLNRTKGGLLLNDYEKEILKRYDINYDQYTKLSDLVFDIETIINESYDYDMSSRTNSIAHQIKNEKIIIKYTEKLYKNAYKYLKKNKKALLKIADLLLEKKVIYKKDLELSLKDYSIFDKQKKN